MRKVEDSYWLISKPVNEVSLTHLKMTGMPYSKLDSAEVYVRFTDFTKELEVVFKNDSTNEQVKIAISRDSISIDRRNAGIDDFHGAFAAIHSAPLMDTTNNLLEVFLDRSSIEVFLDGGEVVLTDLIFPRKPYNKYIIEKGKVEGKLMAPAVETIQEERKSRPYYVE
ncbi:MAG: GH32 C-terminal domain-containing protein [Cyclobacteriaceae bacterium]